MHEPMHQSDVHPLVGDRIHDLLHDIQRAPREPRGRSGPRRGRPGDAHPADDRASADLDRERGCRPPGERHAGRPPPRRLTQPNPAGRAPGVQRGGRSCRVPRTPCSSRRPVTRVAGRFAFGEDRGRDVPGVELRAPLDSGTVSPARIALRVFGAAAAALLLLAGLAGPALGHAELDTADPADKAVLQTPPTTITLTFTEDLDPSKSSFKLLAPDGSTVGTGGGDRDPDDVPGQPRARPRRLPRSSGRLRRPTTATSSGASWRSRSPQPAPSASPNPTESDDGGVTPARRRSSAPSPTAATPGANAGPVGRAERAGFVDRRRPAADRRRPDPRRRRWRLRPAPKPRGVARPGWA